MTREQVKQELKELQNIRKANQKSVYVEDKTGLEKKYDKAMENLSYEEKTIFFHHIYLNKPYYKIAWLLDYSEETIRKKFSKIIDKLALENKPKSNFDKITSSVDALAEFIETISVKDISKERIVEWLQQECNE